MFTFGEMHPLKLISTSTAVNILKALAATMLVATVDVKILPKLGSANIGGGITVSLFEHSCGISY
ncbi:MAG: hypothetical protein COA42_23840 [Alteromonadaceae bacterium]|nr:MAG: hypothetical protein COA42_23840 [Alteromonadaceae bacterium]